MEEVQDRKKSQLAGVGEGLSQEWVANDVFVDGAEVESAIKDNLAAIEKVSWRFCLMKGVWHCQQNTAWIQAQL